MVKKIHLVCKIAKILKHIKISRLLFEIRPH